MNDRSPQDIVDHAAALAWRMGATVIPCVATFTFENGVTVTIPGAIRRVETPDGVNVDGFVPDVTHQDWDTGAMLGVTHRKPQEPIVTPSKETTT